MKRRNYLKLTSLSALAGLSSGRLLAEAVAGSKLTRKTIPSSGERIPMIGMGTWLTFNMPTSGAVFAQRLAVLRRFFELGGGMIDSSPMYGNAEAAIGAGLDKLGATTTGLFSATKVWSAQDAAGRAQFENSFQLWGRERIDLQQVHNLVNWKSHMEENMRAATRPALDSKLRERMRRYVEGV